MRIKLLLLVGISALWLLSSGQAQAHFLKSNNDVSSVLHVEPNDTAVAKQTLQLLFFVNAQPAEFRASDCQCTLTIAGGGATIARPVLQSSGAVGVLTADVAFPHSGIFQVILQGSSRTQAFPAFSIVYSLPVKAVAHSWVDNPAVLGGAITVAIAALAVSWGWNRGLRRLF